MSSRFAEAHAPDIYNSIILDDDEQTVTLLRPVSLDLGAVAKGLAIDLAAKELRGLPGFVVNAGGDIFASGLNSDDEPWRIGIRHPRHHAELLTSSARLGCRGLYLRGLRATRGKRRGTPHHESHGRGFSSLGDQRHRRRPDGDRRPTRSRRRRSFSVPQAGVELLERQGVDGLIVGADLELVSTAGMERYR